MTAYAKLKPFRQFIEGLRLFWVPYVQLPQRSLTFAKIGRRKMVFDWYVLTFPRWARPVGFALFCPLFDFFVRK
jgi:hypothetical protein